MHSSECPPCQPRVPETGAGLLLQLGRLIIRSRSGSPAPSSDKPHRPSTSNQIVSQPQPRAEEEVDPALEEQLANHISALWTEQIPICIEVLLAPECMECYRTLTRADSDSSFDKQHLHQRGILLEKWTMHALPTKSHDSPSFINSQWLLNAVRSQLHFSQLSAWLARLHKPRPEPVQRRRKLSREQCNYKKIEANCDTDEQTDEPRKLNIVYSIKIPGESYKMSEFNKPPTDHTFPVTDIGQNVYLKVVLQSLPRLDDIPTVKCSCQKRRLSKEIPKNIHDDLVGKLNDLTLGTKNFDGAKEKNVLDDRMLTPCSESGKHKCSCDDESDSKEKNQPKKLDERRLKEIAKYKRRLRKEKMRKICDSTSSEGDNLKAKETTSIPILQASRFDRFRAIGCYRNQTYLTLPASRIETKSPFIETDTAPPPEFKKTNTIATQTDFTCQCGNVLEIKCDECCRGMVRSDANYNLASLSENGTRRKLDEEIEDKSLKKHKCDTDSLNCDNIISEGIIKRPKFKRFFPIVDRLERIVNDRNKDTDIKDLHLKTDDSVFSVPKESKRQKTFSIGDDDYVLYEKCDYGTIDRHNLESPKELQNDFKFAVPDNEESCDKDSQQNLECFKNEFKFPDPKKSEAQVPSPSEMDRFRWTFDSAASMVFHTKTGLPLTSSPAPLRRGNNCFDFDDSINGISGIKSALFHPISPVSPAPPASPASPAPAPRPIKKEQHNKLKMGPSTGLLGSFEESALQGRLEAVATVHGFTAELGASGAFCPPHKRLPVTVFFYAPGGTNAPYMGHINLGPQGYRVARSGTIQVSLFNPHGTLVKMFVVLYDLTRMPPLARTFLRQRTLYMPAGADPPSPMYMHKWLRYLIHLRFMTSKSGKLYLHTDIRLIVSRKADLDTATAHSAIFRPIATPDSPDKPNKSNRIKNRTNSVENGTNSIENGTKLFENGTKQLESVNRSPNRVFGGCGEFDTENQMREICYEKQNGVSYELRSFTYAPENPKFSPR